VCVCVVWVFVLVLFAFFFFSLVGPFFEVVSDLLTKKIFKSITKHYKHVDDITQVSFGVGDSNFVLNEKEKQQLWFVLNLLDQIPLPYFPKEGEINNNKT
jgi:hypothetical protein